jgi:hypothetical protein
MVNMYKNIIKINLICKYYLTISIVYDNVNNYFINYYCALYLL